MGCGRKEYRRLKEKKYKDVILVLKASDETFWTYDEDVAAIERVSNDKKTTESYVGSSINKKKSDIQKHFSLQHLTGDAYKAVPKNNEAEKESSKSKIEELKTIPVYKAEPEIKKSCDNCFLRISEECTVVKAVLCKDYKAAPPATREEKEARPDKGDASAFREGEKRYYN